MRAKNFIAEQLLDELAMTPNALRSMTANINALAGMEFEMYVPNVKTDNSDQDAEYDYDVDRRPRDIDDIIYFFSGDDNEQNGSLIGERLQKLHGKLENEYFEWSDEEFYRDWKTEGKDSMRDYMVNNGIWDEKEAITLALQQMDITDEQRNAAEANEDLVIYSSKEAPKTEGYRIWVNAVTIAEQALEDKVEDEWLEEDGELYQHCLENYKENEWQMPDEGEWIKHMRWNMSDIENEYSLDWPYWTYPDTGGELSIDDIGEEFGRAIGKNVITSDNYHGAKRDGVSYILEPDGSLDQPDSPQDGGLEFVSPPLPLQVMLTDLKKVREWAGIMGCYTNRSTGLHINVSVPSIKTGTLDYVKLALLLGDKYVLETFGRSGNTFCKSAFEEVKRRVIMNPDIAGVMLEKMKGKLDQLASQIIHNGDTGKYISINNKEGYVEFRSPGGDWLDDNFDKIEPTLLRTVVALDAACDPEKSRQEYLKKLYLLLAPNGQQDPINYFAQYSAGTLPKAALRSFIKQIQLQRAAAKPGELGQKYWYQITRPDNRSVSMEVVGTSPDDAKRTAAKEWGHDVNNPMTWKMFVAKPIRKYDEANPPPPRQNTYWTVVHRNGRNLRVIADNQQDAMAQSNRMYPRDEVVSVLRA